MAVPWALDSWRVNLLICSNSAVDFPRAVHLGLVWSEGTLAHARFISAHPNVREV
jgi:hypothetical protein